MIILFWDRPVKSECFWASLVSECPQKAGILPVTGLTRSLPLSPGLTWAEFMFRAPRGLHPGLRFTYLQLLPVTRMQPNSFFGSHGYVPVELVPCLFLAFSHSLLIFRQKTGGNYQSPAYSTKASSRLSFQSIRSRKKKNTSLFDLFFQKVNFGNLIFWSIITFASLWSGILL